MKISIKKFWNIFLLLFCISNTKIVKPGVENEYKKQQLRQDCKYEIANYFAVKTENKFCIKDGLFFEISPENKILNLGTLEKDLQSSSKNKNIVQKFLIEKDEFVKYICTVSSGNTNLICEGEIIRELLAIKNKRGILYKIEDLSKNIIDDKKLFERLMLKYQIGDYEGAIRDLRDIEGFSQIIRETIKGILLLGNGDYKQSLKYLNNSIKSYDKEDFPIDLADIYIARGLNKMLLENIPGAILDTEKAIELSPNKTEYLNMLGKYHFFESNFSSSLDAFKKVSALEKNFYLKDDDFLQFIGVANLELGNYLIAISNLSKHLENRPNSESYVQRGTAYEELGYFDLAFKDFNNAIELDPTNIWGYLRRAYLNFNQDKFVSASLDFEKVYQLSPENIHLVMKTLSNNLAFFEQYFPEGSILDFADEIQTDQIMKNKYNKLLDENSLAIRKNRNIWGLYNSRGILYTYAPWISQNILKALNDFNSAIELNPKNAGLLISRGEIKLMLNEKESAMEDFNKAIKIDPNSKEGYSIRGQLKKDLRDFKGFLKDMSQKNKIRTSEINSLLE